MTIHSMRSPHPASINYDTRRGNNHSVRRHQPAWSPAVRGTKINSSDPPLTAIRTAYPSRF